MLAESDLISPGSRVVAIICSVVSALGDIEEEVGLEQSVRIEDFYRPRQDRLPASPAEVVTHSSRRIYLRVNV